MSQRIDTATAEVQACKSCGTAFQGKYCNQCGEKVLDPEEKSIKNFIGSIINALTFLDNKFFRTLKLMLKNPGSVSYQYMNGNRVPFIKPMSMFFIANLLYFLFPLFNSLNSSLNVQMNRLPHSTVATTLVEQKVDSENLDFNTFEIQYNQQSTNLAKLILILLVVYFSIPLFLINYNRKMFYFDHLLVALETCSLIVLLNFVLLPWLLKLVVVGFSFTGRDVGFLLQDTYTTWISLAILSYLFFRIERAAYSQNWWKAIGKSAVLAFAFYWVLQLYRASLFFITLWTV